MALKVANQAPTYASGSSIQSLLLAMKPSLDILIFCSQLTACLPVHFQKWGDVFTIDFCGKYIIDTDDETRTQKNEREDRIRPAKETARNEIRGGTQTMEGGNHWRPQTDNAKRNVR